MKLNTRSNAYADQPIGGSVHFWFYLSWRYSIAHTGRGINGTTLFSILYAEMDLVVPVSIKGRNYL